MTPRTLRLHRDRQRHRRHRWSGRRHVADGVTARARHSCPATRWPSRGAPRARRSGSSARSSGSRSRPSRRATGYTSTTSGCTTSRATTRSPTMRATNPSCHQAERATFQGFRRANGKVGTRNYIGVLSSVNCSATVAKFMAAEIERSGILDDYPNIDGIVPLVHANGCVVDSRGVIFDMSAPHELGLRHQPEHGRRRDGGTRLRGLPDRALQGGLRHRGERSLPHDDHSRAGRHAEDRRPLVSKPSRRCCPIVNDVRRETVPASELVARAPVRRVGRLLGHHGQPGAWRRGRHARAATAAPRSCPRRQKSTAPSIC